MTTSKQHRAVSIERTSKGRFTVSNAREGRMSIGTGDDADFTPTELLLASIGACTAIDVDFLTSRRAEPTRFEIKAEADKVRDEHGNRLTDIAVRFSIDFPDGEEGDAARALLPDAVAKSHDRLCTVGRTVELASPVATHID